MDQSHIISCLVYCSSIFTDALCPKNLFPHCCQEKLCEREPDYVIIENPSVTLHATMLIWFPCTLPQPYSHVLTQVLKHHVLSFRASFMKRPLGESH
jgi:hypothetical protein